MKVKQEYVPCKKKKKKRSNTTVGNKMKLSVSLANFCSFPK